MIEWNCRMHEYSSSRFPTNLLGKTASLRKTDLQFPHHQEEHPCQTQIVPSPLAESFSTIIESITEEKNYKWIKKPLLELNNFSSWKETLHPHVKH